MPAHVSSVEILLHNTQFDHDLGYFDVKVGDMQCRGPAQTEFQIFGSWLQFECNLHGEGILIEKMEVGHQLVFCGIRVKGTYDGERPIPDDERPPRPDDDEPRPQDEDSVDCSRYDEKLDVIYKDYDNLKIEHEQTITELHDLRNSGDTCGTISLANLDYDCGINLFGLYFFCTASETANEAKEPVMPVYPDEPRDPEDPTPKKDEEDTRPEEFQDETDPRDVEDTKNKK